MSFRSRFRPRLKTDGIVIHIFPNLPNQIDVLELERSCRCVDFLQMPYHFVIDQTAEVVDGRSDANVLGGFSSTTIDIAILCSGSKPSKAQQQALDDLINLGLRPDYPDKDLPVYEIALEPQ